MKARRVEDASAEVLINSLTREDQAAGSLLPPAAPQQ
jgi:hypothetical protein